MLRGKLQLLVVTHEHSDNIQREFRLLWARLRPLLRGSVS